MANLEKEILTHSDLHGYTDCVTYLHKLDPLYISENITNYPASSEILDAFFAAAQSWLELAKALLVLAEYLVEIESSLRWNRGRWAYIMILALEERRDWICVVTRAALRTTTCMQKIAQAYMTARNSIVPLDEVFKIRSEWLGLSQKEIAFAVCGPHPWRVTRIAELEAIYEEMRIKNIQVMVNYYREVAAEVAQLLAFPMPPVPYFMPVSPEAA